jgi:hypothetical protein
MEKLETIDRMSPTESKSMRAAQFKLKISLLAFFEPSLARKAQSVTRKRVNFHVALRAALCRNRWLPERMVSRRSVFESARR